MPTRSGVIRAKRRAIGGRRLRCRKGKSCSAACINRNKHCLVDAPTPVAGSLPRAVRAIQSRKERLGPREERQALQRRRDYVKESVKKRIKQTFPSRMAEAATQGNRREYNRLEAALMKVDPKREKGEIWRVERARGAVYKLKDEMEKAARSNDRAKYDELEAKLLRIKNKGEKKIARELNLWNVYEGSIWAQVKGKEHLEKLESIMDKGKREGVSDVKVIWRSGGYSIVSNVLGNRLEILAIPGDTTTFTINGSFTSPGTLSRREEITITREVRRQYDDLFKFMNEGTVFRVSASTGDGKEDTRERGYVGRGFSKPDSNGNMYGRIEGGKIVPITGEEYRSEGGGEDFD